MRSEVRRLLELGLLSVESVGPSDIVRRCEDSPLIGPLLALADAAGRLPSAAPEASEKLLQELAAYGAPFARTDDRGGQPRALEDVLLDALVAASEDATILRVLPLVLSRHASSLDWPRLKDAAHRRKLKPQLGMLAELTADLTGRRELAELVKDLKDARLRRMRYFHKPRSRYEREAAAERTPPAVRQWGFLMNMGEDIFRETMEKHASLRD